MTRLGPRSGRRFRQTKTACSRPPASQGEEPFDRILVQAASSLRIKQVRDLVGFFDFAGNGECAEYDECSALVPFIQARKAVFHVEYSPGLSEFCRDTVAVQSLLSHTAACLLWVVLPAPGSRAARSRLRRGWCTSLLDQDRELLQPLVVPRGPEPSALPVRSVGELELHPLDEVRELSEPR